MCNGLVDACEGPFKFETVADGYIAALATAPADFSCAEQFGDCADFEAVAACAAASSKAVVEKACLGQPTCTVAATVASFGGRDPCSGVVKRLFVRASGCDAAPSPPTPAPAPAAVATYVIDMGQNFAGVGELSLQHAPPGVTLTLRYAELLDSRGYINNGYCSWPCHASGGNSANQTDQYVTKGGAQETWTPAFTYHGTERVVIVCV